MSKELEMLRNGLAQFGRGAGALGFDVADLRRILARLEAAERVCESCDETDEYHYRFDVDALRAYRALDGKGDGDEQ